MCVFEQAVNMSDAAFDHFPGEPELGCGNVLATTQPPYLITSSLFNLLAAVALHLSVSVAQPPTSSSLCITDRSFQYASPCLWNQPPDLSVNLIPVSLSLTCLFLLYLIFSVCRLTTLTILNSLTHYDSWLKTYLFHKSFPS